MFSKKIYYVLAVLCIGIFAGIDIVYSIDGSLGSLTPQVVVQKSDQVVSIKGEKVYVHSVRPGQTLYSISRAYNVSQQLIEEFNPQLKNGGLKAHGNIFIPFVDGKNLNTASNNISSQKLANQSNRTEGATSSNVEIQEQEESIFNIFGKKRKKNRRDKNISSVKTREDLDDYGSKVIYDLGDQEQPSKVDVSTSGAGGQDGIIADTKADQLIDDTVGYEIFEDNNPLLADFDANIIDIALLMPLYAEGVEARGNNNFVDFYQGFRLAADQLSRNKGIATHIKVLSTSNMSNFDTLELRGIDLIVGPVYERDAASVIEYSRRHRIAMVSPLSDFVELSSPYLFQVAPVKQQKYDKIKSLFNRSRINSNIVMLMPDSNIDNELVQMVDECRDVNIKKVSYVNSLDIEQLESSLQNTAENIIIVPMTKESQVEQVLSRLISLNTMGRYRIKVIGSSVWSRFSNLNLDLLYKLSASYVSSYHADRTSPTIRKFQSDYIKAYGSLPTLFSMRGYDVGIMFISSLNKYGTRFPALVDSQDIDDLRPLDVMYDFYRSPFVDHSNNEYQQATNHDVKSDRLGSFMNHEWVYVNYMPDYSIELK